MEQVVSQFFFFREYIKKSLKRNADKRKIQLKVHLAHQQGMGKVAKGTNGGGELIYDRLLSDPHLLTVAQMDLLVEANPFAYEYLYGLGREYPKDHRDPVHLSTYAKENAIYNLNADFDVIGITESMPTMFALLSRKSRIPLEHLCETRDLSLGIQTLYSSTFGSAKRPKGMDLFSKDVYAALEAHMADSVEVYEAGRKMHLKQLREEFPEYRHMPDNELFFSVGKMWAETCCPKEGA
jgi:hypothetical protein